MLNVSGHGQVNGVVFVVPLEGESAILCSVPVFTDLVVGFEGIHEMEGIKVVGVLDSKVINHECKGNGSCVVAPKAQCHGTGEVPMQGQDELQLKIGK